VTRAPALRATALLALAAFAVHQLRYLLVPDAHAAAGHAYLSAAPPVLTLLLAAALGRTLVAVVHGERGGPGLTWLGASAALLALHAGQEAAERVIAGGGPIDPGVLLVIPLAVAGGWLIAWMLRGSEALAVDALPVLPRPRPIGPAALVPVAARPWVPTLAGVARHLAGRAPPAGC